MSIKQMDCEYLMGIQQLFEATTGEELSVCFKSEVAMLIEHVGAVRALTVENPEELKQAFEQAVVEMLSYYQRNNCLSD